MVTRAKIAGRLIEDVVQWVVLLFRSTETIRAENLFLCRQLALYIERGVQPRRVDDASCVSLALLGCWRSCSIGAALWWSCSRQP